jgi:hypothetical protein
LRSKELREYCFLKSVEEFENVGFIFGLFLRKSEKSDRLGRENGAPVAWLKVGFDTGRAEFTEKAETRDDASRSPEREEPTGLGDLNMKDFTRVEGLLSIR